LISILLFALSILRPRRYNHAAIWADEPEMWPRAMFTNGFVKVDNEKMSKSLGNFLSLVEAVELFSADATRLALASAGDSLEDANFERAQATACVKALTDELAWITAHLAPSAGLRVGEMAFADLVVLNDISQAMTDVQEAYESMRYAVAVRDAFYGMRSLRDLYSRLCAATGDALHATCVETYIKSFVAAIAPICPHFAEHCWSDATLLNKVSCILCTVTYYANRAHNLTRSP
jgi:leucyl-tRNA synthetase